MNVIGQVISELSSHLHGNSLKARSARGATILGSGVVVERGLRFARNMILVRLLVPEELGLMALMIAATIVFEAFTEVGIRQSIIQNKNGAKSEYLNVAWWIQCLRGLGLYGVAFLCAPWVCQFYFEGKSEVTALYQQPELVTLLRVAFLAILFNGLISPRAHVLDKQFRFGRSLIITQGSGILSAILAATLAFFLRNVWALVIGFAAEASLRFLFSFLLCPFRPRLEFDVESRKQILAFARGIFGLPILTLLAIQTDVIVLGKVVTAEQLGKYAMVYTLARLPIELFARMFSRVLLSTFSEKQDHLKFLSDSVLAMSRTIAMFGMPLIMFMIICARPLLLVVFGAPYAQVAVPFSILTLCALLRTQEVISTAVYLGMGRPHLHRRFIALRTIIIVCLIYPGSVLFGLTGAALVLLLANFTASCLQILQLHKAINLNIKRYVSCWFVDVQFCLIVVIPLGVLMLLNLELPLTYVSVGVATCCIVWGLELLRINNFMKDRLQKSFSFSQLTLDD